MNDTARNWQLPLSTITYRPYLLIFLLALSVRILLIFVLRPYHDLSRFELERTALSLAGSGVYGNPYAIPTGPTAHVSPGYTVILAALFHLLGTGVPAEITKEVLACLISAAVCASIPAAARSLSLGDRTGLVSGVFCALIPFKPLVQIDGDWEAPYTALFLVALSIAVLRQWKRRDWTVTTALKLGVLWGLALLFSSVLLPVLGFVLLLGTLFFRKLKVRQYLLSASIQLTVAVVCLLPWIIRNQISLGAPIVTRSNFGIELRVSNNNEATPDQRVNYNLGVYDHFHPLQSVTEARKVLLLGEVAYNKTVLEDTEGWIRSHFSKFLALCAGRVWDFWFYPDPSKLKALLGDATALLGFVGLLLAYRNSRLAGSFTAVLLLLYSAPSYFVHVGARQRYPIDWLLTSLSVYALLRGWEFIRRSDKLPITNAI